MSNTNQFKPSHSMEEKKEAFARLLSIMDDLREQCPWDRVQTMNSLRSLTIEETYELADAILDDDLVGVSEELGDLLLHIAFYSRIGDEKQCFDILDVMEKVSEKLIHRHPHIYADVKVADEEEVKRNWEQLKLKEGKKSVLAGVPRSLPAMVKAMRIQEKAAKVGFQWENVDQVWDKVLEEAAELRTDVAAGNKKAMQDEFGDLVFALINYARYLDIDPETALEHTNKKFIQRFNHIEKWADGNDKSLEDMTLQEMDSIWDSAKASESGLE